MNSKQFIKELEMLCKLYEYSGNFKVEVSASWAVRDYTGESFCHPDYKHVIVYEGGVKQGVTVIDE